MERIKFGVVMLTRVFCLVSFGSNEVVVRSVGGRDGGEKQRGDPAQGHRRRQAQGTCAIAKRTGSASSGTCAYISRCPSVYIKGCLCTLQGHTGRVILCMQQGYLFIPEGVPELLERAYNKIYLCL
eukprot:1833898-Rhodomonas_salina.1